MKLKHLIRKLLLYKKNKEPLKRLLKAEKKSLEKLKNLQRLLNHMNKKGKQETWKSKN